MLSIFGRNFLIHIFLTRFCRWSVRVSSTMNKFISVSRRIWQTRKMTLLCNYVRRAASNNSLAAAVFLFMCLVLTSSKHINKLSHTAILDFYFLLAVLSARRRRFNTWTRRPSEARAAVASICIPTPPFQREYSQIIILYVWSDLYVVLFSEQICSTQSVVLPSRVLFQ